MKLKFNDKKAKFVSEVFGWNRNDFENLEKAMFEFFKKLEEADNQRSITRTEMLEDFLQSEEYKKLNISINSENDYFMIGYGFASVIDRMKPDIPDFIVDMIAHKMREHDLEKGGRKVD